MEFDKVVVAGGGTLGSQISFMCAFNNKDTVIWGRNEGSLTRAKERVSRWEKGIQKDKGADKEQIQNAREHLHYTTDFKEALMGADLVIEALTENSTIKRDFYEKFAKIADVNTVIVTNTSTLLPSQFAEDTGRPNKYLGYHFANEIWKNNTAEIMSQAKTNSELPKQMANFSREIGMVPIIINKEQPGYLLNSLLVPFLSYALLLWYKGVADPETIDKTWMIGTGAPVGPFAIMDAVGMKTMYEITSMSPNSEVKEASQAFKKMIANNQLGRETKRGFYTYPNPMFKEPNFLK